MKILWILISISILTLSLSCSDHDDLENKNQDLTNQNIRLRDSIDFLSARPDLSGFPDSLRIDTTGGLFGSLYIDTLILLAEYADCGGVTSYLWGEGRLRYL